MFCDPCKATSQPETSGSWTPHQRAREIPCSDRRTDGGPLRAKAVAHGHHSEEQDMEVFPVIFHLRRGPEVDRPITIDRFGVQPTAAV